MASINYLVRAILTAYKKIVALEQEKRKREVKAGTIVGTFSSGTH